MSISDDDEKTIIEEGVFYKYSSAWIHSLESETHWRLYWRQQKIMQGALIPGDNILEIGVGSGFTANYLQSKGMNVTTLDIDPDKKPDIIANIVNYDFPIEYDHILAFEVFEHIPFPKFKQVIRNLSRKCSKYLFLSVPIYKRVLIDFSLKLPRLEKLCFKIAIPKRNLGSHHHWEIGYEGIDELSVVNIFIQQGFHLKNMDEAFRKKFFAFYKVRK